MSRPQAIPTNPSALAFVCSPRWFHHSSSLSRSSQSSQATTLLHPLALNALPADIWPLSFATPAGPSCARPFLCTDGTRAERVLHALTSTRKIHFQAAPAASNLAAHAHAGPLLTLECSWFELSLEMPHWPAWSARAGRAMDSAVETVLDPLRLWTHTQAALSTQDSWQGLQSSTLQQPALATPLRRPLRKNTIAAAIASMALLFALGANPKRVAAQAPTEAPLFVLNASPASSSTVSAGLPLESTAFAASATPARNPKGPALPFGFSTAQNGLGFRLSLASSPSAEAIDLQANGLPSTLAHPVGRSMDFNGQPVSTFPAQWAPLGRSLASSSLEWSSDLHSNAASLSPWPHLHLPKALGGHTDAATDPSSKDLASSSESPPLAEKATPLIPGFFALTQDEQKQALSGLSQRLADEVNGNPSNIHKWTTSLIEQARERGIEPMMALAVMSVESRFDANAHSKSGAVGLMQIIPSVHREELHKLGAKRANDPISNIAVGLAVLDEAHQRSEKVGGGWALALSYYNGSAKDRTRAYAKRVLREKQRLEQLLRGQESLASQGDRDETLASAN